MLVRGNTAGPSGQIVGWPEGFFCAGQTAATEVWYPLREGIPCDAVEAIHFPLRTLRGVFFGSERGTVNSRLSGAPGVP